MYGIIITQNRKKSLVGMMGMSLVVQWLRCHTPSAGGPGSIPGQGSRFHMQQLSVCMPQLKILLSQINKYLNFKKEWCCLVAESFLTILRPPWTVALQAPLSMEFSWQERWSGLPFPSPGDLPDPGIEPASPVLQADSLPLSHLGSQIQLNRADWIYRVF